MSGPGRREANKQANRTAILDAGRRVFAELGYGAASVRDIVRRTDLATGTFYNYFPDKASVFRTLLDEHMTEARARARAARLEAASLEEFVGDAYRAYFSYLVSDPDLFLLVRRNSGTVSTEFAETAFAVSVAELEEDLRAFDDDLLDPADLPLMASAMVGAAYEIGVRIAETDDPDIEQATRFATQLFLGGIAALKPLARPTEK